MERRKVIDSIVLGIVSLVICIYGGYVLMNRRVNPFDCETNYPMRDAGYHQCIQAKELIKRCER